MVLALEELGLSECFDAVYGSSAGALAGSWLVGAQAAHCCAGWYRPGLMERVTNPRRGLRGQPGVDVEQPLGLEAQERLADRGAAHRERVRDLALGDEVAAGERAVEDAGLRVPVGAVLRGHRRRRLSRR